MLSILDRVEPIGAGAADPWMVAAENGTHKGPEEDAADSKQSVCQNSLLPLKSYMSASFDEATVENDKEGCLSWAL